MDLCGAYNLLRIKERDEHLTAFRTKYGSYEYLVTPFGLTNSPASFQHLVNDIFADFLDIVFVVYLDDIIVISRSEEEHIKHVASLLQIMRDNNLFSKASKCVFHASSVEYLGYVVSSDGLNIDSSKVQKILNWHQPKSIKALQSFLVFANFYHCFIKNYSKNITALTSPLTKYSPFIFNGEALSQFQILKDAFTTAPILLYLLFCKPLTADINYEIHDKELLGIVWALKRWRAFLLSLFNPFEVLTDHSSLQYFMSSKVFTCCQDHWPEFLSEFHFNITYLPGRLATSPDALSHQDDVYPERGVDFISKNPQDFHQVIKQDGIQESRFFAIKAEVFSYLVDKIQKEVWKEKDYKEILKQLARGESVTDFSLEPQPSYYYSKIECLEKTLKLIKRDLYWAGINQFIKDYVSSCQQCSISKNIHHKKFGLLKPLQIQSCCCNSLSMDFITQLPLSNSFDSILVAVDRFPKMAVFIPAYGTITSRKLAQIFISHAFSKHVLPVSIVSDRGSLFVSSFWTNLCQQLKISRDLSTAFHPETDGQTER
ncbi:hypothetical protein O181_073593, partial [Austropuccinia psidii MF-1]|nr:hypothetical protein [Austropuccinia psidii MF-1]